MKTFKSIFNEEIKVGDKIMYITVRYNDIYNSFGIVKEIQPFIDQTCRDPNHSRLYVHKTYEISRFGREPKDQYVHLYSPTIFICSGPHNNILCISTKEELFKEGD